MCGRYKNPNDPHDWSELKIPTDWRNAVPDYTGPYDSGLIIRAGRGGIEASVGDQWAYVPPYSDSRHLKYATFNARVDRLLNSRVWRTAFPGQRCVIPLQGYFEWVPEAGSKKNRPWYVTRVDGANMYMAGIWGDWTDTNSGQVITTFTMLTTQPNTLMQRIGHDRMPVILAGQTRAAWLDPDLGDRSALIAMVMPPHDASGMQAHPVGYAINYRAARGPEVTVAVGEVIAG